MRPGQLQNNHLRKGQVTIEFALAFIIVIIFFLGAITIFRNINQQIASESTQDYNGTDNSGGSNSGSSDEGSDFSANDYIAAARGYLRTAEDYADWSQRYLDSLQEESDDGDHRRPRPPLPR